MADKTVLLIDEHQDTNETYKFLLESMGYSVVILTKWLEVINYIRTGNTPDLVIMGATFPAGRGLLKSISELLDENSPNMIVVGTTLDNYPVEEMSKLGVVAALRRPVNVQLLKRLVKIHIK